MKTCTVIDKDGPCNRPAKARGYCTLHYQRWKSHGDPMAVIPHPGPQPDRICTVDGCNNERKTSKLYCEKCRGRMRRHGDVTVALKDHTPAIERWKTSYEIDPVTGCWNWTGPSSRGYGYISNGAANSHIPAHRFVWEQIVGPIPRGLVLDHHGPFGCRNKLCVNPAHLEAVPQSINALRGECNAAKTHCKRGHEFTLENTYIHPATGWRQCRLCGAALMRRKKYRYAYIYLYRPDHPIADKAGKVQEHRMVLYDDIGPGPHPCHWCGTSVNWGGRAGINVDHVNGDPSDNRRENLVPSCQHCNKSRAKAGNLADWQPRHIGAS